MTVETVGDVLLHEVLARLHVCGLQCDCPQHAITGLIGPLKTVYRPKVHHVLVLCEDSAMVDPETSDDSDGGK